MLLGQISLDLGSLFSSGKNVLALVLIAIAVGSFAWPWLKSLFGNVTLPTSTNTPKPVIAVSPKLKRRDVDRSSDTPPPAGFSDHLRIIEATAPNADAKVWWEYAKAEMTEAEVAIAEAKLARRPDPAATV